MTDRPPPDLSHPSLYLNRELSLLEFNQRVLAQALDAGTPVLERLRFLTISSTNLDEFFEVRAASHGERAAYGSPLRSVDGLTSGETLIAISKRAHELVEDQYEVLNDALLPALEEQGIRLLKREAWSDEQRRWIKRHFKRAIEPVLTPMALDPAHPFPRILNKSLNFVVLVEGDDAYGREAGLAIVQVPRALPRIIELPPESGAGVDDCVLLSSIIHAHIERLFKGMRVHGCYQFRVTRNGDLWVDEEEVGDLLKAIEGELPERHYAEAIRLEVAQDCSEDIARFLLDKFDLAPRDLYRVRGPVNLHRLQSLYELVERPDLKYEPFVPRLPRRASAGESIFDAIRLGDIVLHHPYEAFSPVVELLRQAAADPGVLAIKQTLYRTGGDSAVVAALIEAAHAGKQVTAVIELRARFDEQLNIDLAMRLQEVGANVVYGIVGYKTHAKLLMVVRREGESLRRYCHLGTGNYHVGTARTYTDIGYLTAREDVGEDVHRLFMQLTGLGAEEELAVLLQSPFTLLPKLIELIEAEGEHARAGQPARIIAKMNAITEPLVIQALYRASQAGVEIDLIVRGACCLRPGVPGVSERIRVRSIVGRFLEHSRLYFFLAGGEQRLFCSSADWMSRNLRRRVESCFPIDDPGIRERLVREDLEIYLAPNVLAWELDAEGRYTRSQPTNGTALRDAQRELLETVAGSVGGESDAHASEELGLLGDVVSRQGMPHEPPLGKRELKRRARDRKSRRRDEDGSASSMKTNGKPKKKDQS
jgi:polyphosphate kinase